METVFPCPHCSAPVPVGSAQRPPSFPFCSDRCRTIDLAAWADGAYSVPGRSLAVDVMDGDEQDGDPLEALRRRAGELRGDPR